MPQILEDCVSSLLGKWKKSPGSRPTPKKDKKGKPQDARSQAFAICTASLKKAEKLEGLFCLEGVGPAILGVGATNRPHIKFLPEVSRVEREGRKLFRIPLLVLGKWKHSRGVLDFTTDVVERMVKNFKENVVGNRIAWDNRHKPEIGALAWFEEFTQEEDGDKKLLVGYAEPTPNGDKVVDEKRYRYASVEFQPDYENPLVAALSSDELEPYEEEVMPDEIQTETVTLEVQLQEAMDALKLEREQREGERESLETRIIQLEQSSFTQFVSRVVLEAEHYRDPEGRAHSKVLLDFLKNVLLEETIGETIELEERDNPASTRAYYRKAIAWLAKNLPGVVPAPVGTEPDKTRTVQLEDEVDEEALKIAAKELWEA